MSWRGCVSWCVVGNYLLAPCISSLHPDVSLMEWWQDRDKMIMTAINVVLPCCRTLFILFFFFFKSVSVCALLSFLLRARGPAWDLHIGSEEIQSVTSQIKQNLSVSSASPQSGFMVCESLRTHLISLAAFFLPPCDIPSPAPLTSVGPVCLPLFLLLTSTPHHPHPMLLSLRRLRRYEENHHHTPVEHARFATSHLGADRIWNWLNCPWCKNATMWLTGFQLIVDLGPNLNLPSLEFLKLLISNFFCTHRWFTLLEGKQIF